jgi:hypothetical protein
MMGRAGLSRGSVAKEDRRPTAFVSYAQSSRDWQQKVFKFTVALRDPGGVDAEIDLFHDVDHQRWATFGANLIESSDFTLIAVDGAYKRRWLGMEQRGVGAGVAREAAAIRAIYERDQEEFVKRIKLVLLPGIGEEDVPGDLLGDCERFRVESFTLGGLEGLLRSIHGRSAHPKPDLAPIPKLPPKAIAKLEGKEDPEVAGRTAGDAEARAADATDASDAQNLRGQLRRVQVELKDEGSSPVRKDNLLREETALELSLDALAQVRRPRRRAQGRRAPERPRAERSGRTLWWSSMLIVLAAAIVGVALVRLPLSLEASPRPVTARASGVQLQGPPGWREQAGRAGISGLEIATPVSLTPGARGESDQLAVVAGISEATGAKLLPAAYRGQLGEGTEKESVDLGSLEAYRYDGLETVSGEPLTVFVAPTSNGAATLACRLPERRAKAATRLCSRIASTFRLTSGVAYQLGPSSTFAKAIARQFGRLQRHQNKALGAMDSAERAERQGNVADRLATDYRNAASGLASLRITPESEGGRRSIVGVLRGIGRAYTRLAVAARKEDVFSYVGAKRAVAMEERLLRKRLGQLQSLGYRVEG